MDRVAIVGASLAGVQAAQSLRRGEYQGAITLIGDEAHYPYDRPPLSKNYLAGDLDADRLRLRPTADPDELGLDWALGRSAVGLEPSTSGPGGATIHLDDGRAIEADGVVIATGARARTIGDLGPEAGVHVLRSLDDADGLRAALATGPERVVVIGCGFIGAEVAATVREAGHEVTIIEAAPAPLLRVLDHGAGMAIANLHRTHGVDVRLGVGVAQFVTDDGGAVRAVELDDGTTIDTSVVVVGIGVVPNTEWLADSGLTVDDGVVTDETCLAAPGIVAAGDVARWPHHRLGGRSTRVEQWDNAVAMGAYAGTRLLAWAADEPVEPFGPVPWFWSDQYDRKIQLAGLAGPGVEIVQGTVEEGRFVQLYLDDAGEATGALCWNRPRHAIMARQFLTDGAPIDEIRAGLA